MKSTRSDTDTETETVVKMMYRCYP